jgi:hypothetical protein
MENTETVTITKIANGYQLTVQHDQSGSAYGCDLSEAAYQQLRLHFVNCNALDEGEIIHYNNLQECCNKILDAVDAGKVPRRAIMGLRLLMNR